MKILWIVNTIFPAPSKVLGIEEPVVGGWMYGLAGQLSNSHGNQLAVATTYAGNNLKIMTIENIVYYLLPSKSNIKYDSKLEKYWLQVYECFQPDLIHIHGTEYAHGLACMRSLPDLKYVVSIQGLVSVYAKYYYAGIGFWDILKNITLRDIIRFDNLFQQKKNFEKRGEYEKEYISRTKHVVGRTSWDMAHTKHINRNVIYHFCNESLRNGFYEAEKWSPEKIDRYSIFLSQGGYPIKGLHQVIKAAAILKSDYPYLKIRIGGSSITKSDTLLDKLKLSGYGKYIKRLLVKFDMNKNVLFLGTLSEKQMIAEYRKAHVFICPSKVENSPNSLAEAQLLGVPCVAAYVGGIPDMVEHKKTGLLYRFEEVEMLAENIQRVFEDDNLASQLSQDEMKEAEIRHDGELNLMSLVNCYNKVVKFA